jgi:hypothetical protein
VRRGGVPKDWRFSLWDRHGAIIEIMVGYVRIVDAAIKVDNVYGGH